MDHEDDTGTLVAYLSQTIEESKRLRDDLTHGRVNGHVGETKDDTPSQEDASAALASTQA